MFEDLLTASVRTRKPEARPLAPGECQTPDGRRCHLCFAETLAYDVELEIKNVALQEFWSSLHVPLPLELLVPSPLGRAYRTVTKRRVFTRKDGSVYLGLIDSGQAGKPEPFAVEQCAIEPAVHAEIYRRIQESIVKAYASPLAEHLSYVVLKGNYREFTLLLNVRELSPRVISAANTLSKSLSRWFPAIVGVFLYLDETGGRYYLGSKNPRVRPKVRKLFGKPAIFQKACGKSFLYSPLSFSQVNQSMIERLVSEAGSMLALTKEVRFYDLYCGYGLFALCLAEKAASVVGVELSHDSIQAAIDNASRQKAAGVRFMQSDITAEALDTIMKQMRSQDRVLLDPPRSGTSEGVIETIAAMQPAKVVHLFCNIDVMPAEIKRWRESGYMPTRAVPLDMFPGTASVETMIAFEKRETGRESVSSDVR